MYDSGDVILANVPFVDENTIKKRPALVLFEEFENIIIAGITSNTRMDGILLTKEDGIIKESIIKLNYIFTISTDDVVRVLFHLNDEKKKIVYDNLMKKLSSLSA